MPLIGFVSLILLMLFGTPALAAAPESNAAPSEDQSTVWQLLSLDERGWTLLRPANDTRTVFVSASQGHDSNLGMSPEQPVRTLHRAQQMLRNGRPDWILLRRGDTWDEDLIIDASGRSSTNRLVISTYGATGPRPTLRSMSIEASNVAVVGLALTGEGKDKTTRTVGLRLRTPATRDVLLEDLLIQKHKDGLNLSGGVNIAIRRCVIVDNARHGIYTTDNFNLLVEQSCLDSNGLNDVLDHNIYKGRGGTNLVFRDNIIAGGANHGIKIRAQSTNVRVTGNVFVRNRNDLAVHLDRDDPEHWRNHGVVIAGNAFIQSGRNKQQNPIFLGHVTDALVRENIIVDARSVPWGSGIILGDRNPTDAISLEHVRIVRNIIHGFSGDGIRIQSPAINDVHITHNTIGVISTGAYRASAHRVCAPADDALRHVTYLGNVYCQAPQQALSFRLDDQYVNADGWKQAGKEQPMFTRSHAPDIERACNLSQYAKAAGLEANVATLLAAARAQSRTQWDSRYTATAVFRYLDLGYAPLRPAAEAPDTATASHR